MAVWSDPTTRSSPSSPWRGNRERREKEPGTRRGVAEVAGAKVDLNDLQDG